MRKLSPLLLLIIGLLLIGISVWYVYINMYSSGFVNLDGASSQETLGTVTEFNNRGITIKSHYNTSGSEETIELEYNKSVYQQASQSNSITLDMAKVGSTIGVTYKIDPKSQKKYIISIYNVEQMPYVDFTNQMLNKK